MKDFIEYMRCEEHKAENTLIAYRRDLTSFERFMSSRGITDIGVCTDGDAVAYVMEMNRDNLTRSTINRRVSVLRTYYDYCVRIGERADNPFGSIKTFRPDSRAIDYLTVGETEKLLSLPDDTAKGIRDKALMEFMYGTGARVTEVVRLQVSDINIRMGFVTLRDCDDESRIVPLGRYSRAALEDYLGTAYEELKGGMPEPDSFVFINYRGQPLTRQGIWKILRDYGKQMDMDGRMTPQILRDSFAVHILQNGGDLKTLQELMGFDDLSVGLAYLAVIDIHVRDVYMKTHPRA